MPSDRTLVADVVAFRQYLDSMHTHFNAHNDPDAPVKLLASGVRINSMRVQNLEFQLEHLVKTQTSASESAVALEAELTGVREETRLQRERLEHEAFLRFLSKKRHDHPGEQQEQKQSDADYERQVLAHVREYEKLRALLLNNKSGYLRVIQALETCLAPEFFIGGISGVILWGIGMVSAVNVFVDLLEHLTPFGYSPPILLSYTDWVFYPAIILTACVASYVLLKNMYEMYEEYINQERLAENQATVQYTACAALACAVNLLVLTQLFPVVFTIPTTIILFSAAVAAIRNAVNHQSSLDSLVPDDSRFRQSGITTDALPEGAPARNITIGLAILASQRGLFAMNHADRTMAVQSLRKVQQGQLKEFGELYRGGCL